MKFVSLCVMFIRHVGKKCQQLAPVDFAFDAVDADLGWKVTAAVYVEILQVIFVFVSAPKQQAESWNSICWRESWSSEGENTKNVKIQKMDEMRIFILSHCNLWYRSLWHLSTGSLGGRLGSPLARLGPVPTGPHTVSTVTVLLLASLVFQLGWPGTIVVMWHRAGHWLGKNLAKAMRVFQKNHYRHF